MIDLPHLMVSNDCVSFRKQKISISIIRFFFFVTKERSCYFCSTFSHFRKLFGKSLNAYELTNHLKGFCVKKAIWSCIELAIFLKDIVVRYDMAGCGKKSHKFGLPTVSVKVYILLFNLAKYGIIFPINNAL